MTSNNENPEHNPGNGKSSLELWEEQLDALGQMSAQELAAYATAGADQAKASQAELTAEADARRARRYQAN